MPSVGHFGQLFSTKHTLPIPIKLLGTVGTYLRYLLAQKEISKKTSFLSYKHFSKILNVWSSVSFGQKLNLIRVYNINLKGRGSLELV